MAVQTMPKRKAIEDQFLEWVENGEVNSQLEAWLQENDESLFGARATIKNAMIRYKGDKCSRKIFLFHARRFCKFWQSPDWKGSSSPSSSTSLSADQWDKLHVELRRMFSGRNVGFSIEDSDITLDFIIRVLRIRRAPASRNVLANCSLFKTLCDGPAIGQRGICEERGQEA